MYFFRLVKRMCYNILPFSHNNFKKTALKKCKIVTSEKHPKPFFIFKSPFISTTFLGEPYRTPSRFYKNPISFLLVSFSIPPLILSLRHILLSFHKFLLSLSFILKLFFYFFFGTFHIPHPFLFWIPFVLTRLFTFRTIWGKWHRISKS